MGIEKKDRINSQLVSTDLLMGSMLVALHVLFHPFDSFLK